MNKQSFVGHTVKDVTLKSGTFIPEGTETQVKWEGIYPYMTCPGIEGVENLRVSNKGIAALLGLHVPNLEEIGAIVNDSEDCTSVTGECVEPDGYDQYGAPSWLLTLGLI